jgi:hypothetical protein
VNAWVERDSGQPVDFSGFLSFPFNICLLSGEGGAMFAWRGPGVYEVHLFLEQSGREAMNVLRVMLDLVETLYGARLFWAAIPLEGRCEVFEKVVPCRQ